MSLWRSAFPSAPDPENTRIALVAAEFNDDLVTPLLENTLRGLRKCQIPEDNISVSFVPGSFELPFAAKTLLETADVDAIITLGVILRGDTIHFDLVAEQTARSLSELNTIADIPIIFGVLACDTRIQAEERLSLGSEFAKAAIKMVSFCQEVRASQEKGQ